MLDASLGAEVQEEEDLVADTTQESMEGGGAEGSFRGLALVTEAADAWALAHSGWH